ncbi:MAG: diguanylate cyclase, partial [Hyphomicrobiaceae bacterium]|nr:diguanylate cyclase [Hyphomicrobiaceae bacterium]
MAFAPSPSADWTTLDPVELIEIILALVTLCAALCAVAISRQIVIRQLRRDERASFDLYANIKEGVFRSTLDGRMISANPALVRLNGFDSEAQMLREVNDIAGQWYVDPNRRSEIHEMLLASGEVTGLVSEVYRYRTRERIWVEESTRLVRDEITNAPLYYDGTVREVTETMRRVELQRRHDKIASVISGCLYQHRHGADGRSTMPYASPGIVNLLGVPPEAVAEDSDILANFIHPDDIQRIVDSMDHSEKTLTTWHCEYRVLLPCSPEKWLSAQAVPEREPDGSTLWHGIITDVSERKRSEAKIYDLAYFDPLTRLPNRSLLIESLGRAIAESATSGRWGAALFIDLDQFKFLNDTKGHHVGDQLLRAVAERLREWSGDVDTVARLGGDEFFVVRSCIADDEAVAKAEIDRSATELLKRIGSPFELDGYPFRTTASIGAVLFNGQGDTIEQVMMHADLAMYEVKAAGRAALRFFETEMKSAADEKLRLTDDLRSAIENGQLKIAFQPQIGGDGRCFAAEALLRWPHPERGVIKPASFLPLADMNGLAEMIDVFVLNSACATLKQWQEYPATRSLGLAVTDQTVKDRVMSFPSFKGADGNFDPVKYQVLLRNNNFTEATYLAAEKNLAVRQQLLSAIGGEVVPPKVLTDAFWRLQSETRAIEYIRLAPNQAGTIPAPSEADLKTYFEANKAGFRAPEYRALRILHLTPAMVAKDIVISDDDLKKTYETVKERLTIPERRQIEQVSFGSIDVAKAASERLAKGETLETVAKDLKLQIVSLGSLAKTEILDAPVAQAVFGLELNTA